VARRPSGAEDGEQQAEESLLQAYVQPAVLLEGRRFSLRAFLVLYAGASADAGLVGYAAREALALLAPVPWAAAAGAEDRGAHVTNQSAAQLAAPGQDLTRDVSSLSEAALEGWPGGLEALWAEVERVAGGLLAVARGTLLEPVGELQSGSLCALVPKVLGLDLLLSAEAAGRPARAWLLEVNRHPSLGERYSCARRVKRHVLLDAWRLLWAPGCEGGAAWPGSCGCLRRVG